MKKNVYYVVEPREKNIDSCMDIIGESQFLWGSDYPHVDSSADALDQIFDSTATLTDERRRMILGENAKALYGL
jgi:predicted TIM-barrel fold metal-dependent hydrolase